MNAIAIATTVLKLLPVITGTIDEIEHLDQSEGKGKEKLQAAIIIIRNIYGVAFKDAPVTFDQIQTAVESIIAAVVNFKNITGQFKTRKDQKAAAV